MGFVRNEYGKLFENSAHLQQAQKIKTRIFELSEFLIDILQIDDLGAKFEGKATYHDSCAALRECKIKQGPRQLLSKVAGLELVEMNDLNPLALTWGNKKLPMLVKPALTIELVQT